MLSHVQDQVMSHEVIIAAETITREVICTIVRKHCVSGEESNNNMCQSE